MYHIRVTKYYLCLFSLLLSATSYAQKADGWTYQYGFWEASGVTHFNFSRPEFSPAFISRASRSGNFQEVNLFYQRQDSQSKVDITYFLGLSYGVSDAFEYCEGAFDPRSCENPPPLKYHRQSIGESAVYVSIVDYEQDLIETTYNNYLTDYFSPPIIDYNWFVGYVYWREPQWTRGNEFVNDPNQAVLPAENLTTGNNLRWSGSRFGITTRYLPKGVEGITQFNVKLGYVLTSVSGSAFDVFYIDTDGNPLVDESGLGPPPHINYSGTGSGIMAEVEFLFQMSKNVNVGVGYRDWHLKAKGYLQHATADPEEPNYIDRYRLTNVETRYSGTRVFLEFSF